MLPTVSSFPLVPDSLPLELKVGFIHLCERELNDLSGGGLERDLTVRVTRQGAFPAELVVDWLTQHEFHLLAGETFEVFWFGELPLDAGRTDFQGVTVPRYDLLDVEDGADLLR